MGQSTSRRQLKLKKDLGDFQTSDCKVSTQCTKAAKAVNCLKVIKRSFCILTMIVFPIDLVQHVHVFSHWVLHAGMESAPAKGCHQNSGKSTKEGQQTRVPAIKELIIRGKT